MKNQLLNLIRDNVQEKRDFRVKNMGEEATLYLYDVIDDMWGISAEMVARELADITASTIHLRINSPGGDVFAARAIQTALAQHPARVIAHIDGVAASAATFITAAADEIRMTDGGFYMIHKGWTITMGNADDMRSVAGLLDQVDESIVRTLVARTGQSDTDILQWMAEETWMSAQEAKDRGFIDEIDEVSKGSAAQNMRRFDLSAYEKAPEIPEPEPDQLAARAHLERRLNLLGV
ncbi:head maturation protease, ClpP-related [Marinobacter subterrani]|uniref:ATP-dependent Clp protease proteolytic subunit n=1 Tax=Marinobacter subterrani TaxID=1658765 RepID=A0A0J7M2Q7_9GAMM|nr:head maturation protease, ClpP-related [Marinobacter subterrani]KMQ75295.1 ATP-dependent protease ClpP, protease subunit [Marinobacter subterrani]